MHICTCTHTVTHLQLQVGDSQGVSQGAFGQSRVAHVSYQLNHLLHPVSVQAHALVTNSVEFWVTAKDIMLGETCKNSSNSKGSFGGPCKLMVTAKIFAFSSFKDIPKVGQESGFPDCDPNFLCYTVLLW